MAVHPGKTNSSSLRITEKLPAKKSVVQMRRINPEHSDEIISSKTDVLQNKGKNFGLGANFLSSEGFYIKFFKFGLLQKCKNFEKQKISLGS